VTNGTCDFANTFVLQLVLFANSKFAFTKFLQQNEATFSNLFILNPKQTDGNNPLPNPIATLYTREELQEQINYTINRVCYAIDFYLLACLHAFIADFSTTVSILI